MSDQKKNEALRDLDSVTEAVRTWRTKAFVVGVATVSEIPSGHKVVINVVPVDPDEPGCTYPTGGSLKIEMPGKQDRWEKLLGLGATVLQRIAQAAGLDWIPEMSGRIDDGHDRDKIVWQATASHTDLSGAVHTVTQVYELNFSDREAELVASKASQYDKKASDPYQEKGKPTKGEWFQRENPDRQKWIDEAVRADMLRMRITGMQRAETGAKSRVIANALGIRRGGYIAEDLKVKPFAVFRLVDDIDWQNDPVAHGAQILRASGLAKMLAFGGARQALITSLLPQPVKQEPLALPAGPTAGPAMDPDAPLDVETDPVVVSAPPSDAKPVTTMPTAALVTQGAPSDNDPPTPAQFAEMSRDAQINLLAHLVATRDHMALPKKQAPQKPLTEYPDASIATWYTAYLACPAKPLTEDVP